MKKFKKEIDEINFKNLEAFKDLINQRILDKEGFIDKNNKMIDEVVTLVEKKSKELRSN